MVNVYSCYCIHYFVTETRMFSKEKPMQPDCFFLYVTVDNQIVFYSLAVDISGSDMSNTLKINQH